MNQRGYYFNYKEPEKTAEEVATGIIRRDMLSEARIHIESRRWEKNNFNFDDVKNAMLALYTTSTFEGWP